MSLVFGLCLTKKIYLVSDSRLTYPDGSYKDDFSKWLNLNAQLSVVVANSAYQSCWLLRKIREDVKEDWDFSRLEVFIRENIVLLANQFYAETGRYGDSVGMIFGGFDNSKKLQIDAARLGDIMSAPVRKAGEGVTVHQSVDSQIKEALLNAVKRAYLEGRGVGIGTTVEVESPMPRVMAVTVSASDTGAQVSFENARCYDGLVFNPQYKTERIVLPDELIGDLEYRDKLQETEEDTLYQDQGYIITHTIRILREKDWPTVGGNIVPLVIMPDFSGFAMGDYTYIDMGSKKIVRGGISSVGGRMHYLDENLVWRPYRFIYDYLSNLEERVMGNAKI